MASQAPAAPPVPGSGSKPQLPAPSAPPPPTTSITVSGVEQVKEQFYQLLPQLDKQTFDLVRRVHFSEVAKLETIIHVANLCKEKQLDILAKPFHVVTIKGKDYIWASIALYRIIAHRTGQYIGLDAPEYGPTIKIQKWNVEVPEWCQVTVHRLVDGRDCSFTQRVYYKEQVVTHNSAPNDMWDRRPMGQMAKGAESAALRAAFPEIGTEPTIEEMEGREHEYAGTTIDADTGEVIEAPTPQQKEENLKKVFAKPDIKARQQKAAAQPVAQADTTSGSDEQATQEEQPAAPEEAKGESAPPPPPPAAEKQEAPPAEAEQVDDAEVVEDDPVVTKTELGGLLQISRGQGFADSDMATIVCKRFGIKSHQAMTTELRISQWKEACNWFADHTPGDEWE